MLHKKTSAYPLKGIRVAASIKQRMKQIANNPVYRNLLFLKSEKLLTYLPIRFDTFNCKPYFSNEE
jgi:hypothetical protein